MVAGRKREWAPKQVQGQIGPQAAPFGPEWGPIVLACGPTGPPWGRIESVWRVWDAIESACGPI